MSAENDQTTETPVDPALKAIISAMREQGLSAPVPYSAEAMRNMFDTPVEMGKPGGVSREPVVIEAGGHDLEARLYRPENADVTLPAVLFFHGGGWVHGTLETHDGMAAGLAKGADCAVLSLGYRLAPEHPFPAAYDDGIGAWNWLHDHAQDLRIDRTRMAVAGDSAGGNLAAALSCNADPAMKQKPVHQLLFYPAVDGRPENTGTYHGEGGLLTGDQMRWYWDQYAPAEERADPHISPLLSPNMAEAPPATIILAKHDVLCAEGLEYAARLEEAGVAVELHEFAGGIHGFASFAGMVPLADDAMRAACQALQKTFAESRQGD